MLIDTFIFNKDFNTLRIRLAEIGDIVDLIVVSESTKSHSGLDKPAYLSQNTQFLGKYSNKTKILITKSYPRHANARIREMIQREAITHYLKQESLEHDDFIIHSDCDEIPRRSVIQALIKDGRKGSFLLDLDNYANALNLRDGNWARLRIVTGEYFQGIQRMRRDIFLHTVFQNRRRGHALIKVPDYWTDRKLLWKLPQFVRRPNLTILRKAGWHFNNLFEEDEILNKINSSSHIEWATKQVKESALQKFRSGRDIYNGKQFTRVSIDQTFPKEIQDNLDFWARFIR